MCLPAQRNTPQAGSGPGRRQPRPWWEEQELLWAPGDKQPCEAEGLGLGSKQVVTEAERECLLLYFGPKRDAVQYGRRDQMGSKDTGLHSLLPTRL